MKRSRRFPSASSPARLCAVLLVLVPTASVIAPNDRGLLAASNVAASVCQPHVVDGVIPSWAQAGFRPPDRRMPYEIGAHGRIAALLWAYPLLAPPPTTHNNKILWVSDVSTSGAPLVISAQRMIGSDPIGHLARRTVVGGPGPSIINLPVAGCWRLELRWSGHGDTLDLEYLSNPGNRRR
jgi:hypothetical protein